MARKRESLRTPLASAVGGLQGLDFSRLSSPAGTDWLQQWEDRAAARLVPFQPITPQERLEAFRRLNWRPHGLFVPEDEDAQRELVHRVRRIGEIASPDVRLRTYHELQDETERWSAQGMDGYWNGQQALARSTARFRIAAWGRRGGKTTEAAMEAVGVATMRPRSWIWLAAPTMKLVSRAFDKVMEVVRDQNLRTITVRDTTQEKLCVLDNYARLEGISLENIWSAAGAAIDLAIIDEAAQIYPEAWARAILPPLTDRNGQALLISSWEGEGDFFHAKALEARADMVAHGTEAAWELFQDASYDINFYAFPQGRETPALAQARKEMEPHEFLEQFGGIPASARERVFPEFKEKVHVTDVEYNPDLPVILACDPSGGSNAYAILAIQEYTDMVVIFDEIYETHRSTEEIAEILCSRPWIQADQVSGDGDLLPQWEIQGISDMICDSAQPEDMRRWQRMGFPAYIIEHKPQVWERIPFVRNVIRDPVRFYRFYRHRVNLVLERMGREPDSDSEMNAEEQRALTIEVEEGLNDEHLTGQTLQYLRSCSRLRVDRSCTNTINEFKTYTYPKRRRLNQNYQEKPRDWMNHCLVAGTMVQTDHGEVPIEEIQSGDRVLTRVGWREVISAWCSGTDAPLVRLEMSNGRSLIGTPEHKIWTCERGWVALAEVTHSDTLIGCPDLKRSSTQERSIGAIRIQNGAEIASTSFVSKCCTSESGKIITVPFQTDITSTTLIRTLGTTPSKTWPVCLPENTTHLPGVSASLLIQNYLNVNGQSCYEVRKKRVPGMHPKMASVRTVDQFVSCGKQKHRSFTGASGAERGSNLEKLDRRNTALELVQPLRVITLGKTTRRESVRAAELTTVVTATVARPTAVSPAVHPIATAVPMGHGRVYDLMVEAPHEFFANGVLVSNSQDAFAYYVWVKKRFEGEPEAQSYSYLETHIEPLEDEDEQTIIRPKLPPEEIARMPQSRARMFAEHVRTFHSKGRYEPQSYLEVAG